MSSNHITAEVRAQGEKVPQTQILPIDPTKLGRFSDRSTNSGMPLEDWDLELDTSTQDGKNLQLAASHLKCSDIPVAFPTETVYGLGADATRSAAVKGIYQAKQRPSDNPLIVHIASLKQLRRLLSTSSSSPEVDPIPQVYHALIQRFWPGPITIILPVPENSELALEVTAGLRTFGARMPRDLLALALIKTADVPVAAPSANASTKPSPTAAEHVRYDLDGRIELIVDGGPCDVGVESTVVDGLSSPPAVLRPGGIGIDSIKTVPGWENTVVGYHDISLKGDAAPRAPGMKYRHYSPKAPVMLVEATGGTQPSSSDLARQLGVKGSLGFVRTKKWQTMLEGDKESGAKDEVAGRLGSLEPPPIGAGSSASPLEVMLQETSHHQKQLHAEEVQLEDVGRSFTVWDMCIGPDTASVARGLFSALRELDRKNVDAIVVEGIDDEEGDIAAAVMNRLRKAAEVKVVQL
ncbi:translation factor [Aureobasidium subglaciale]|nr:translation factor [Aureobasidium subglaciale]KAI5230375.1 translation factor [Aureobasidium subglaciale]KAI5233636.1 translation factor [Aureobasidium subglaciale]KAI5266944.1 translation factor [Aureobasidium subglaciale]